METRQRHDSPDSIKSEVFFDEYDWEAVDYGRIPDSADVKDIRSEHEAMKAQKIYEEMRAAALEREEMTIRVRPEDSVTTQRDSEEQKYRAACTVLLTRLHHRATEKDIKRFFEKHAGKVKHVHLLYQLNSKQSKGICYLEFVHKKGAERALECNTHSFFDRPLNIQQSPDDLISVADKEYLRMCRTWGPTRVQVTNFHPRLTIQDITELFSPYGKVDDVEIIPDDQCGASGLATIIFRKVDEAKAAIKAMDGYELMGLEVRGF